MTKYHFHSKFNQESFRPFLIQFKSGRQLPIDKNSELIFPKSQPNLVIAFTSDGIMCEFEFESIESLIEVL